MDPFIEQLNRVHLCSWYLLPPLGLNPFVFREKNFVNAYVVDINDDDGKTMLVGVEVLDKVKCNQVFFHPSYYGLIERRNTILLFQLDESWRKDYNMFLQGKYSRMSPELKQIIKLNSGLKWEVEISGECKSDAVLLALDKDELLKQTWMEVIGVGEQALPDEYLSKPPTTSFLTIERMEIL